MLLYDDGMIAAMLQNVAQLRYNSSVIYFTLCRPETESSSGE